MTSNPYAVVIVVDREYGDRLSELPPNFPVWIVNTPSNRAAAERVWANRPDGSHLVSVTTFNCREGASAEQALVDEFDTIDLHHGTYSSEPPYTGVEVIGTQLSDTIRTELSEYGFNEFHSTAEGFRAVRPIPGDVVGK